MELSWFSGRRVFVTGHTGFKGGWLCRMLLGLGAQVYGYALPPDDSQPLYDQLGLAHEINSTMGDVRDEDALMKAYRQAQPQAVVHMAAQPLVRQSYRKPAATYATNVMGTVNLLECVRRHGAESVVLVTTDKVYRNVEKPAGYREDEALDGHDPYSNSKSCAELVARTYRDCFFAGGPPLSTARAGNVIGGGDRAGERIVPDCVRAGFAGHPLVVRHAGSVRPYQHVLEPLGAYLLLCAAQADNPALCGAYNIGPDDEGCVSTGRLARLFADAWGEGFALEEREETTGPHEAGLLRLDNRLFKDTFGWQPRWGVAEAVAHTVRWEKAVAGGQPPTQVTDEQIRAYFA